MTSAPLPIIVSRTAASLLGGYLFTWGFTVLGISSLVLAGVSYHEAQTFIYLVAFLVFLAVFCWAFAVKRVGRAWAALVGGGLAMTGAGWLLARVLA